jgi:hypothetical protein
MTRPIALSFLFLLMFASARPAHSSVSPPGPYDPALPFAPGERLVYDVAYNETPMGEAIMEVTEKIEMKGREVYHLFSRVKSNRFLSFFSKIEDEVESYIDTDGIYSHLVKINKRRKKGDQKEMVVFDYDRRQAVQLKNDRHQVFDIPPKARDILSTLYFLRAEEGLTPGNSTFIDVYQNGKNWRLEARALRRERLTTPFGTFDTLRVQMEVPPGGILGEGTLMIWFTDDDRRIPVLMKSKGKKGLIVATLSSHSS